MSNEALLTKMKTNGTVWIYIEFKRNSLYFRIYIEGSNLWEFDTHSSYWKQNCKWQAQKLFGYMKGEKYCLEL